MSPRNWAAFYRSRQSRAQRALAEGQHRPEPLVVEEARDDQVQDTDHTEDDRD